MAGTSSKTTVVSVRVPNDTHAEWQSVNSGRGLAAYVLERAMRPDLSARVGELAAEVAEAHGTVAALRRKLDAIPASVSRPLKFGETQVSLIVPAALVDRMPAGDRVAMMEDALILRYGNGVIKRVK